MGKKPSRPAALGGALQCELYTEIILIFHYCLANSPQTQQLQTINNCYFTQLFGGQEFGSGFAGLFKLRVSHEVTPAMEVGLPTPRAWLGLEDPPPGGSMAPSHGCLLVASILLPVHLQ